MECTIKKDEVTLTNFIKAYIENCNTIVSDGWRAYQNLTSERYNHDVHVHGRMNFGFGLNSTSTIEFIWNALKSAIKKKHIE